MLHLRNNIFSSTESDIFEQCGRFIMLPCEKTRSTNADVAGTLNRRESSDLKQLYSMSEKSFASFQSSQFMARMYFDSLRSGRALGGKLAAG